MLTVGSLFSGIGGLEKGLEDTGGFKTLWQVEIDDYASRVLAQHWPDVARFRDVRDVGAHNLVPVDLICGGFPCPPVSRAGAQQASADKRWLWPEFVRIVSELRPRYALVENVPGLLDGAIGDVLGDLAALGFDAEWEGLPAAAFGAPHIRDRVFIVAYPNTVVRSARLGYRANGARTVFGECHPPRQRIWMASGCWPTRMDDGVPSELYRARSECLGNAVVPQVSEWIGRRILEAVEVSQ